MNYNKQVHIHTNLCSVRSDPTIVDYLIGMGCPTMIFLEHQKWDLNLMHHHMGDGRTK